MVIKNKINDEIFHNTIKILKNLIKFQTVSRKSNLALIEYCENELKKSGATSLKTFNESKTQANLFSTIKGKSSNDKGIVLSGHTDVVPAIASEWTSDPYEAREEKDKIYGRGTSDMKSFIACTLAVAPLFKSEKLKKPIHFSFTFDEETGCLGVPLVLADLKRKNLNFSVCIIGEPTSMKPITSHKGYNEYVTHFTGLSGHASNPDVGVSAIEYAIEYSNKLLELRNTLKKRQVDKNKFFPPYSTLQIGKISGGTSANVIADKCSLEWEVRPINKEDDNFITKSIDDFTKEVLLPKIKKISPKANIKKEIVGEVIGFNKDDNSEAVNLICNLTGDNTEGAMSFGTEAGLFQDSGISTVICGPGSIDQAHTVDEYITYGQIKSCLKMLISLRDKMN